MTRDDDDYPELLRQIHDPPLCLYLRGDLEVLKRTQGSLAIVGSRRTTRYGVKMATSLARAAAQPSADLDLALRGGREKKASTGFEEADVEP